MKIEYKLVVKAPNRKTYIHEYSENKKELEKKASIMYNDHPYNLYPKHLFLYLAYDGLH